MEVPRLFGGAFRRILDGAEHLPGSHAQMTGFRARVENGRLVIDDPTDLPEGTVLDLVVDDEGDSLTDEERAALHSAIDRSFADAKAGRVRPAADVVNDLRKQR